MRIIVGYLFACLCFGFISASAQSSDAPWTRLLVRYHPSVTPDQIEEIELRYNLHHEGVIPLFKLVVYAAQPTPDAATLCALLSAEPTIAKAEPDQARYFANVSDPGFGQQWYLNNTGQAVNGKRGPSGIDIRWLSAHSRHSPQNAVRVAVIDSGTAILHPDHVASAYVNDAEPVNGFDDDGNNFIDDFSGYDFYALDSLPLDQNGHGTLVAGIIGATINNGKGGAGVTDAVELIPYRVFDQFGRGGAPKFRVGGVGVSDVLFSIAHALSNDAKILNLSLGGSGYSAFEEEAYADLVNYGVLAVIAAGNGGPDGRGDNNDTTPTYPASYSSPAIIAVAAQDRSGALASFSNYGVLQVDIAAPGTDIYGPDVSRQTVYFQDFESGAPGWTTGRGANDWSGLDWVLEEFEGNSFLRDRLFTGPTTYRSYTDTWVTSPFIDLSNVQGARLSFDSYFDLADDYMVLEVSTNGYTWTPYNYFYSADFTAFSSAPLDISDLDGLSGYLRFRLISDFTLHGAGAAIDNIHITGIDDFDTQDPQYIHNDGTSFAAPIVSGVAAMIWSHRPDLTASQVREAILLSARPMAALNGRVSTGGMVDADAALTRAEAFPRQTQTLIFTDIPDRTFGATAEANTVTLAATSSVGLTPISFRVISGPAAITGNTLTITGAGTVAVEASQAGNATYRSTTTSQAIVVRATQTITFNALSNRVTGAKFLLAATATSGLSVAFSIVEGPATLGSDGKTVTVGSTAGTVKIRAIQEGGVRNSITYAPADSVDQSFEVTLGPSTQAQAITFAQPAALTYGVAPLALSATANSGLPVIFELVSTAPATGVAILGSDKKTLTILGAGKVVVRATQPGAYPFKAAAPVTRTLTINKADLAVSFEPVTRLVRKPNPAFTPRYSGFVNGDTAAKLAATRPVGKTAAVLASPEGKYPITFGNGLDANYRFVPGDVAFLTIQGFGGAYEALLVNDAGVPLGKLELSVQKDALTYSGTLHLASEPISLSIRGSLAATDGTSAAGSWSRAAVPAKAIPALSLGFELSGDTLDGELSIGGQNALSIGSGSRVFAQALDSKNKKLPAPWTGAHTLVLRDLAPLDPAPFASLPAPGSVPLPLGSGHASVTIAATGVMTIKGKLPDGTSLTASARPAHLPAGAEDTTGLYRVFARPNGTRLDSFFSGPLALEKHPDQTRFQNRFHVAEKDGLLFWAKAPLPPATKPANQDKSYRQGFACDLVAILDPWIAPATKDATANGVAIPAGTLVQRLGLGDSSTSTATVPVSYTLFEGLDFGARSPFLPVSLNLSAKGAFTVLAPLPVKAENPAFTLTVTPATGAFSGSFFLRDQVSPPPAKPIDRKASFSGTLRQGTDANAPLGHGHILFDPFVNDASSEQISGELILSAP